VRDEPERDDAEYARIWHANRLHRSTEEVNAFIKLARAHKVRLYSTTKGAFYNLEKASGRKELRDDTSEAGYESEHRGERVAIARKRQARQGAYGGGVRPRGRRRRRPAGGPGGWSSRCRASR
jgi:site-specific DNA recombinase